MGYIREPEGVDFVVDSKPLTQQDKVIISEAIAFYKATGRKKRTITKKTSIASARSKATKK